MAGLERDGCFWEVQTWIDYNDLSIICHKLAHHQPHPTIYPYLADRREEGLRVHQPRQARRLRWVLGFRFSYMYICIKKDEKKTWLGCVSAD